MNNTFSIKRFGNYLGHDLRGAAADSGLTLAIIGAMPVFQFFIAQAYSLIISGNAVVMGDWGKIPAYITAFTIAIFFFSAKHYGGLTDKKKGSDWLMLPASSLEKWGSMLLVTCVAVPVFLMAELAATDGLLSLIFPQTYGEAAISRIAYMMKGVWTELHTPEGGLAMSWPLALYLNWCEVVLFFTLGAIWFKSSKIGKTFLAAFIIVMVLSMLSAGFLQIIGFRSRQYATMDDTPAGFIRKMNIIIWSIYAVYFIVIDALLYLRIKTLKH